MKDELNSLAVELGKEIEEALRNKLTFLLIGQTGVGKSSTVNSLMGKKVMPVNDAEPDTTTVEFFDKSINEIMITIIDTPGLCDGKSNNDDYIEKIKAAVEQIDLLWYISKLNTPRPSQDEMTAIKTITRELGFNIWNRSIIVFTHADEFKDNYSYTKAVTERTKIVRDMISDAIKKHNDSILLDDIPSVAISNHDEYTPNGDSSLGSLFVIVFSKLKSKTKLTYVIAIGGERVYLEAEKDRKCVSDDVIDSHQQRNDYVYNYSNYCSSNYDDEFYSRKKISLNKQQKIAIQENVKKEEGILNKLCRSDIYQTARLAYQAYEVGKEIYDTYRDVKEVYSEVKEFCRDVSNAVSNAVSSVTSFFSKFF